jgi:hypothetical protein
LGCRHDYTCQRSRELRELLGLCSGGEFGIAFITGRQGSQDLSEQVVLNCSAGTCSGWYLDYTFNFLQSSGTTLESSFPYQGSKQACQSYTATANIAQWQWINPTGIASDYYDNLIKTFIYTYDKPVSVRMEVYNSFYSYTSGFMNIFLASIIGAGILCSSSGGESRMASTIGFAKTPGDSRAFFTSKRRIRQSAPMPSEPASPCHRHPTCCGQSRKTEKPKID